MLWRILLSLALIGAWYWTGAAFGLAAAPVMNDIAVSQFDGSAAWQKAVGAQSFVTGVHRFGGWGFAVALFLIWFKPLKDAWSWATTAALVLVGSGLVLSATNPAHAYRFKSDWAEYYTAGPDETVFLVPMLADAKNQGKVKSAEFFAANLVSAQYVMIPHGKLPNTGTFFDDYINTAQVVMVKRKPVAREWTHRGDTGTSAKDESFSCETAESHNVRTSVTFAGMIEEANAPKYLYFAGADSSKKLQTSQSGQESDKDPTFISAVPAMSLDAFIDTFGRRIIQTELCAAIGKRSTDDVIKQKAAIMAETREAATKQLGDMGVSVKALGYAGPLDFDDKIQAAINNVYIANKRKLAALELKDAIPALTDQAKVEVMLGFAEALKSGKLPDLPSFVGAIPPEVLDAFKHYATGATVLGVPFTNPSK